MSALVGRKLYTAEQLAIADQRIRRTCHLKQRQFVFDESVRVTALVGRGGGKTVGGLFRLLRRMLHRPDANTLFIAATRQSAERLVWRDLKRIVLESLRVSGARFFEQDLVVELPNGSRLMLFGADDRGDIQKLRGITYHEVVIDEVASIKIDVLDELQTEILGPRLVGALALIGTPGKRLEGIFYETTRPGSDQHRPYDQRADFPDWKMWSSHAWNISDGVDEGIAALAEIHQAQLKEKERNGWSDSNPKWLREFCGMWAADATANVYIYQPHKDGVVWNQWDPARDAFGFAKHDLSDVGYTIGIDIGWKDAFALEVFAFSYSDPRRTLWHVYEVYLQRQYAQTIAKLIIGERLSHDSYGGIVQHIGWPDVLVADGAGQGAALLTELAEVYGVKITEAGKHYKYKENSIELTNSMFYEGRIKVLKGSHLEQELLSLQWVVDQYGKRTENKAQSNHATDALVYARDAVASMLPSAGAEPESTPTRVPRRVVTDEPPPVVEFVGDADSMYSNEW